MREDFLNHMRVFDTGNDLHISAAQVAGVEVDVEDTLEKSKHSRALQLVPS